MPRDETQPDEGPAVRVGIVAWNSAATLNACLGSLPVALDGLAAEVVLVDNASRDDSAAVAERHPHVRVIRNATNTGYARAMNQALGGTKAPVLIALNPDTVLLAGSIRHLVDRLDSQPDVGLVAPRLVNSDGSTQHSVNRFPSSQLTLAASLLPVSWHQRHPEWWVPGIADHESPTDIDWAIGAVHVIRAAALGGTPPYSERWFMYVEDLDLCWRLSRAGWRRRLEADVAVTHIGNVSAAQSSWGDDPALRHIPCAYDFYALAHSGPASRAWAGVNVLALALWSVIGLVRPGWLPFQDGAGGRAAQLHRIGRQRRHMRIHLLALLRGPASMTRRAARPGVGAAPSLAGPPPT